MVGFTIANHDQLSPVGANLIDDVTQLRDLLAAENSAKMPDKRQYHRSVLPAISKLNHTPGSI